MKHCKVKNCISYKIHQKYCHKHYMQVYRHGVISNINYKHGMDKTKFHNSWRGMKERVLKHPRYINRNITLHDKWKIFEYFKNDMYDSYLKHVEKYGEKNTTIERKDNNLGYYPENCRWATLKEQASNKENSYLITYKNETKTVSEWAKILKLGRMDLKYRIKNWGIEKAFSIPKLNNKTRIKYYNKSML